MAEQSMYKTVNKSEKVSDNIIEQIRDSILSGKLKPGDKLSSEKELIEQFGVSKATMREALRVLEAMGLIEMRKGINGGAFVAEVDMKTTIHSIINFLHFQSVSMRDITMLRYLIEPTGAQIAASKISEKDIQSLWEIIGGTGPFSEDEVSKEISFHRYIARMTENNILILLVDFIDNVLSSIKSKLNLGIEFYQDVRKAHQIILECMVQRDPLAAAVAMANDLLEVGRYLANLMGSASFDPSEIQYDKGGNYWPLRIDAKTRVVHESDPFLREQGAFIKRVGSSSLFLVASCDDDPSM